MENVEPDVVEKYNVTCGSYDRLYREEQFSKYRYIFDCLNMRLGKSVADVGCGTGLLYEFLSMRGALNLLKYICIDPSDGMIKEAARKIQGDPRVIFIVSYAENLPLIDEAVDDVFMITVWDNLQNRSKAIEELKRVAREKIVITKHCKTTSPPPSWYENKFQREGTLIDDFYIFKKISLNSTING